MYLGGAAAPFPNRNACSKWFNGFSELNLVATVDSAVINVVKDNRPGRSHLQRALRRIDRDWTRYDGFVVVLPYKNYLYHANILSYMTGEAVEKPIIWATSLKFRDFEDRADMVDVQLMTNILNATVIASTGIAGSAVVGGREIVPASHARLDTIEDKDILQSLDGVHLGYIDFGIQLSDQVRMGDGTRPVFSLELDDLVERFDLSIPDTRADELARLRAFDGHGAIVDGGESLDMGVMREVQEEIPALFVSQDTVVLKESSQIRPIEHLTPASAAAKFLWLFGREGSSLHVRMLKNMIGEHVSPSAL